MMVDGGYWMDFVIEFGFFHPHVEAFDDVHDFSRLKIQFGASRASTWQHFNSISFSDYVKFPDDLCKLTFLLTEFLWISLWSQSKSRCSFYAIIAPSIKCSKEYWVFCLHPIWCKKAARRRYSHNTEKNDTKNVNYEKYCRNFPIYNEKKGADMKREKMLLILFRNSWEFCRLSCYRFPYFNNNQRNWRNFFSVGGLERLLNCLIFLDMMRNRWNNYYHLWKIRRIKYLNFPWSLKIFCSFISPSCHTHSPLSNFHLRDDRKKLWVKKF